MRLIFHGELRKLYGEFFDIMSDTVEDALEGFSRQQENWPRKMAVHAVGYDSVDKLRGEAVDGEVHLVPALRGGSGKFFNIIIGAIMVVVGVIMVATSFGTNAMGWSLIISGSVMILQGVVALFMKSPKADKNKDPDASKYLNPNKNTVDVGTPITMAWGRIDLAGQWLSLQSDSNNLSYGTFPTTPT